MKRWALVLRPLILTVVFTVLVFAQSSPTSASGPIKMWSGIHLGNRPDADWTPDLLARIDGDQPGGIWPKAVVFLSSQLYNIHLIRDGNCRINRNPSSWPDGFVGRPVLLDYLQRASQHGVRIIIRIHPSPGNFDASHNLWVGPIPGIGYCDWNNYRPAYDIADEMVAIHNFNQAHGITEWGFEPANEPNIEWYTDNTLVKPWHLKAWQDMNAYFKTIWWSVPSTVRGLTPPMAQGRFAEMNNINDIDPSKPSDEWCPPMRLEDGQSTGYDIMREVYEFYNDGINWHNYWRLGFEWSGDCAIGAQHVSYFFPQWMKNLLESGTKPGTITEASLFSPTQDPNQPLQDKDDRGGWPTANSLRKFFANEVRAQVVVAWLLSDWSADPANHCPNPEHHWHEAYRCTDQTERTWFTRWWPDFENWTPPVYLPDVRSGDNGWDSELMIQNTGASNADVTIGVFDHEGHHIGTDTTACRNLPPNATCTYNPPYPNFTIGWAQVVASENVAVVVITRRGDEMTGYNGILHDVLPPESLGDPGWEQTGTVLYAPMVKRSHVGRSSYIFVLNVGTKPTTVHVTYYGFHDESGGYTFDGGSRYLEPGQINLVPGDPNENLRPFSPHDTTSWQTLHSAIITSQDGQPLAALVMEYSDSDPNTNRTTHNVFRAGALTLFAPLVKKDWYGQRTGLTVQNVGENLATDVTIRYYNRNGTLVLTLGPDYSDTNPPGCLGSLPAGFYCVVYNPPNLDDPEDPNDPDNQVIQFLGSAVVSSSSQPIVGMVHEAGNNRFMTHVMALADYSQVIYSPIQGRWIEDPNTPDEKRWSAAFMIMNVGDQDTFVTVRLYDENGNWRRTIGPRLLKRYAGFTTWPDIDGVKGSAVATSSGEPIVAEVNYTMKYADNRPTGDTGASFNGVNR